MRKTTSINLRQSHSETMYSPAFYVIEEYEVILFGITLYHGEKIVKGPFWDKRAAKRYMKYLRVTKNL